MKNHYYVDNGGNVQGPATPEQLQKLHRSGQISGATQVCPEGSEQWMPYFEAPEAQLAQKRQQSPSDRKKEALPIKPQESTSAGSTSPTPMTKIQGNILIVLLLIGLGAPFLIFLRPTPKWEYQRFEILAEGSDTAFNSNQKAFSYKSIPDITTRLDRMGQEGWELVSVYLEMETSHPNFGKEDLVTGIQPNVRPQSLVCIFKRPKKF